MISNLISVLTLLSILSGVFSQDNEACPGGGDFNKTTGHIQYYKNKGSTVPGNVDGTCVWNIHVANESVSNNSGGIFLFAEIFFLDDDHSVTIQILDNKTKKSEQYLSPFKGKLDPFGIFISKHSVDTIVTVTLKLSKSKTPVAGQFRMQYCTTGCKLLTKIEDTGVLKFPLYSNAIDPFNCSMDFVADNNDINDVHLTFKELILRNPEDILNITGANDYMNGVFNSTERPMTEILAKDSLTLNLKVQNTSVADNITVVYDLVTEACNGFLKLNNDHLSHSLTTPPTDDANFYVQQNFDCLWIVESEPNTIIKFDLKDLNFTSSSDQILILDGANQSAPFITSLTQANFQDWKPKFIQTSSNKAWISITTPLAMKNFRIEIDVTQTSGGYSSQPGPFGKDLQDGIYLYKFKEGEQVEFTLNENGTVISGETKLTFLRDLGLLNPPIETITKDNYKNVKTIVSMEHTMAIIVEKISGSTVNATLTSLAPGCYAEGSGNAGSYSLTGKCNDKCAWTIPPKNSTDEITLHFTSIQIDSGDSLKISKHDDKETLIVEVKGPLNNIPDLVVNASDGSIIEVNRQNCSISKTMIQASYAVKSVCQMEQSTKGGQTIELSSPNYPNQYPLMALCTYKVTRESNESLLHVSFDSLELALGHNLVLSKLVVTGNKTDQVVLDIFNSSTTTLPNDYLVKNDIVITFVSRSDLKNGLKTAKGFSVKVLNMDNGGVIAGKLGNITTPGYPDKVKKGSLFAWVVSVNAMNTTDTKNIISFKAGNLTKEEELKKFVTIFDGPSIREAPLNNMTGDELLSRTNNLIFLYKHENLTQDGPPMLFEFEAYACNNSLMCDNKICMHEDWKCNGKNDCGDYSDEKDCQGTAPAPPTPSPAPRPATAGGTSTTALTLGILAALIIGILLGVAAPAAYRRIAGNRFSTYSTFSNSPE